MTEQESIFSEKAVSYLVCFNTQCGLHEKCLRWMVGQHVPSEPISRLSINPLNSQVVAGSCPVFRDSAPRHMPVGMTHFYYDMPGRLERAIKGALISRYSRTGYYRYHNGSRPITPEVEEEIRRTCNEHGWTQPLKFDSYVDDYQW